MRKENSVVVAVAWLFSASLGLPINCGESIVNDVVSLDTAALVTGTSKRTLWRRLSAGKLQRHSMDERGRVMLALADIAEHICLPFSADPARGGVATSALLVEADRGDSTAQNDLALLFLEHNHPDIALQWFLLAAHQQHADAMHYLSELYQHGLGVDKCESTAMLWRAKAAKLGHPIAHAQMTAITGASVV